jgi:hypothetical protein
VGKSEAHDPLMVRRGAPPLRRLDHRRRLSAHQNGGVPKRKTVAGGDLACVCGGTAGRAPLSRWVHVRSPWRIPVGGQIQRWTGRVAEPLEYGPRMLVASIPVGCIAGASVRAQRREERRSARSPANGRCLRPRVRPTINVGPQLAWPIHGQPAGPGAAAVRTGSYRLRFAGRPQGRTRIRPPGWVELRRPCRLWSATGALGRKAGGPMTVTTTNAR